MYKTCKDTKHSGNDHLQRPPSLYSGSTILTHLKYLGLYIQLTPTYWTVSHVRCHIEPYWMWMVHGEDTGVNASQSGPCHCIRDERLFLVIQYGFLREMFPPG